MTINYSALLDSGTIQEARDTFSLVDGDLSPLDPSSSASSAQEVSLVIQNPDQNLITRKVNELVTAKVDFKVVQGST
jgi:energy-coupling factor transporter ATP-binding protein EcfA2